MKLLYRINERIIDHTLAMGSWRWAYTAILMSVLVGFWMVFLWLPVRQRLYDYKSLIAQKSSLEEQHTQSQATEHVLEQELVYSNRVVATFNELIGRAQQDCLSCLLAHAHVHAITLVNYQPQPLSSDQLDQQQSWQVAQSACVECIGSYHNVFEYLTSLTDAYPHMRCTLNSLVSYSDDRIRAMVQVHILISISNDA